MILPVLFSISLCSAQAKHLKDTAAKCPCQYPSMVFKGEVTTLSVESKVILDNIAKSLRRNPEGILVITMHTDATKRGQAKCDKRLNTIKQYMGEKEGISFDRTVGICDTRSGASNTADMECSVKGD